jgi:hypothetical protein
MIKIEFSGASLDEVMAAAERAVKEWREPVTQDVWTAPSLVRVPPAEQPPVKLAAEDVALVDEMAGLAPERLPVDIEYALSAEHSAALRREEAEQAAAAEPSPPTPAADEEEVRVQIRTLLTPHMRGERSAEARALIKRFGPDGLKSVPSDSLAAFLAAAKEFCNV